MAKQKILLRRSSVKGKMPSSATGSCVEIGELLLNNASGDAENFLTTLRAGGSSAETLDYIKWSDDETLLKNLREEFVQSRVDSEDGEGRISFDYSSIISLTHSAGYIDYDEGNNYSYRSDIKVGNHIDLSSRVSYVDTGSYSTLLSINPEGVFINHSKVPTVETRIPSATTSYSATTVPWSGIKNVPTASTSTLGVMKAGSFLSVSSGNVSVSTGTSSSTVARGDHSHSTYASKTELENLIQDVEDSEFVTATALNQINASVGLTEGGISQLPNQQTLTDAIFDLKDRVALATTAATGVSKLVTGDLKSKSYANGEAAAAAHTHSQYLTGYTEQYKGTVTSVKVQGTNGLTGNGTVTASGTITISGITATSAATGVSKLVTGDLKSKSYTNGEAAAAAHTHGQYSPTGHTHNASAITGGTFDTARIPTGITVSKSITATTSVSATTVPWAGVTNKPSIAIYDGYGYLNTPSFINEQIEPQDDLACSSIYFEHNSDKFIRKCSVSRMKEILGVADTATTESGHYTPSKSASTYSGGWITGIKLDSKKHVTEVTTGSTAHTHNYKPIQTAVSDPATNGSGLTFIDTISQNANGVITATKKAIDLSSCSKTGHTHSQYLTGYTEQYKGTVTSVKVQGTNGLTGNGTVTASGTITISGVTATTGATGVSKLVTGDLNGKTYANGEAAAAAHTHGQYLLRVPRHSGTMDLNVLDSTKSVFTEIRPGEINTTNIPSDYGNTYGALLSLRDGNGTYGHGKMQILGNNQGSFWIRCDQGADDKIDTSWKKIATTDLIPTISVSATTVTTRVPSATTSHSATTVYSTTANSKVYLVGVTGTGSSYQQLYKNTGVTMSASCIYATSDERLKDFKGDIECDLEKLKNIPKKYFSWKDDESKSIQIGTSAQEVHKLYPEIVSIDDDGTHSVAYDRLSIVALSAIDKLYDMVKELQAKNDKLENRIKELENK